MQNQITIHPDICNGKPTIVGTRITVQTIMEFLEAGDSPENILEDYPALTREDIYACMQFAAKLMGKHFEIKKIA
ncbi:DUF433 domain-containing protein [Synechocystis sp. LEGE 06083]|uniref:DUF433 domain-containing protein n=1 Tax=Synechocystis sp. LEGE 06083 TaxID=915336 RepID=UPI00188151C3|nr:DUF433 domain-containing protein [Synechocystis sp. LEGE 06083]MBE9195805.1 DUF433 domain-containing protein [Synechocystis sp. LEGE 06083]